MEENYSHLAWDTDCFGFNVARIMQNSPNADELFGTLRTLRDNNYKLAYWYVPAEQYETSRIAHNYGGFLADAKVTYIKKVTGTMNPPGTPAYTAAPYLDKVADSALIKLALQSSEHSRFRLDPAFPKKLCDKLYACWITNSVSKDIAWEVLVVKDHDDYLGLITLGDKGDRANIGLIAIAEHARGKAIGRILMADAERHFAKRSFSLAQVVTQKQNLGACRLYESCGYQIDKIENIFHFWF
jgi:dTDP-4-amino-4,6-dideoxy-D-galactose acyltransferase